MDSNQGVKGKLKPREEVASYNLSFEEGKRRYFTICKARK